MDFIRVKDKRFTYRGEIIRLRGFGIGTWLNLEHFMVGMPTSDQMLRQAFEKAYGKEGAAQFFRRYQQAFLRDEDFALLAGCGVNFVRVPFNHRLFIDDNNPGEYKEEGFALFDRLLAMAGKHHIFVMPDLHTTPGCQNPDWHSDNSYGVPLFWDYQAFRRQMTGLWAAIAARYSQEPWLMGYDLLNEPAMAKWPMINEFYRETIAAIRAVDQNHVIVLEGDQFSMDFSGLEKFGDTQLALGFHYYPTVWHPDLLDRGLDRRVRKKKIAQGLDRLVAVREEFGLPAFCGEFGYGADCGERAFTYDLLEDTLELLEERELDWLLWCYKDARFMSMIHPKENSTWMKLAGRIGCRWSQDMEKAQAARLLDVAQEWYPELTDQERYLLQFRLRACLYVPQAEHILVPELRELGLEAALSLPDDFLFENCEVYPAFQRLIKEVLAP